MYAVVLMTLTSTGTVAAAEGKPLDGTWLIVYSEEAGRRNTAWESKVATVSGNTLTYEGDKKSKLALQFSFRPNQTASVTLTRDDADGTGKYEGVYIASRDYLALSLNK